MFGKVDIHDDDDNEHTMGEREWAPAYVYYSSANEASAPPGEIIPGTSFGMPSAPPPGSEQGYAPPAGQAYMPPAGQAYPPPHDQPYPQQGQPYEPLGQLYPNEKAPIPQL